jgi:hypothetical protein
MIPFLVLDRPNGLKIIRKAIRSPAFRFGIMTHVNVSERFVAESNALRREIAQRFGFRPALIVDSGAFIKNNQPLTESELFNRYEGMAASHGIVNDVLGDARATVTNCAKAIQEYQKRRRSFKLVGVAQGKSVDEYLTCYEELLCLGYRHIAVGGLLQKKPRSVRFTQVRSEDLMRRVLSAIRSRFNPAWLYVLGAYHPQRQEAFRALGIWGSDYKGWLFRYPSTFQGFLALSEEISKSFLTPSDIKRVRITQEMIGRYRNSSVRDKAAIRKKVDAFHQELWRSQAIITLLSRKILSREEHRLVKAVFWQSLTSRRESGILHHLRSEVFPAAKAHRRDGPRDDRLDS